jgi:putative acetyltransferase
MQVKIRDEGPEDAAEIAALVTEAFRGAPHSDGSEGPLVGRLRDAGGLLVSLVAEADGRLAGHIGASPAEVGGDRGWVAIAPVSVRPDLQRRGIGTALVQALLARLRATGARGAVLVGDPGYYGRFGFRARPGLTAGTIPAVYVQALGFGEATPRGELRFHPAFGPY